MELKSLTPEGTDLSREIIACENKYATSLVGFRPAERRRVHSS
jgi:hypothetical protein